MMNHAFKMFTVYAVLHLYAGADNIGRTHPETQSYIINYILRHTYNT